MVVRRSANAPSADREGCRPRVEGAREGEILDAAVDLLLEVGYDRLTMDAVASRAKASKATLYRRWHSKPALVVDALIRSRHSTAAVDADTGSLRGDLLAAFCGPDGLVDSPNSQLLALVMTALHTDEEFAAEFRAQFLAPKIEVHERIYARARERGEVRDDVDLSLLAPAMAGILLHRFYIFGQPVDADTVERVVDQIILPAATGRPYRPADGAHQAPAGSRTSTPSTRTRTTR